MSEVSTSSVRDLDDAKLVMQKIDKMVEDALNKSSSSPVNDSGGTVSVDSPATKCISDPAKSINSYSAEQNYQNNACTSIVDSAYPSKRFDYDTKFSLNDSYTRDPISEPRSVSVDKITDNWVNYQFTRLVTDRKSNNQTLSNSYRNDHFGPRSSGVKSVDDIIREYSGGSGLTSSFHSPSILPRSHRMSNTRDAIHRIGWMNRSHNNETLEYDEARRMGSSVDGDVGDMVKTFNDKCTLSGCKGSPDMASHMHGAGADGRDSPIDVPSESGVDFKPPTNESGRIELNEIRSDLEDIHNSFLKERERLRHLETLINKTPMTSSSGPDFLQASRNLHSGYKSRFLSEFSGRKTFSSTDYNNKYGLTGWRPTSPPSFHAGPSTLSTPFQSTREFTPTNRNYFSDLNLVRQNSGIETNRAPSMSSNMFSIETPNISNYQFSKASGSNSKFSLKTSKYNRSYNAKKDKNTLKSQPETQGLKSRTTPMKRLDQQKRTSHYGLRRDHKYLNSTTALNKTRNRALSTTSTSVSEASIKCNRPTSSANKRPKYQPYQPHNVDYNTPSYWHSPVKHSKSECSTFGENFWSDPKWIQQLEAARQGHDTPQQTTQRMPDNNLGANGGKQGPSALTTRQLGRAFREVWGLKGGKRRSRSENPGARSRAPVWNASKQIAWPVLAGNGMRPGRRMPKVVKKVVRKPKSKSKKVTAGSKTRTSKK